MNLTRANPMKQITRIMAAHPSLSITLVRLLKNRRYLLFCIICVFSLGCEKSTDKDVTLINFPNNADINKIVEHNNSVILIGGNSWTYGVISKYDNQSIQLLEETDKELMALSSSGDHLYAAGFNGYLYELGDQIRFFRHDQGQIARDILIDNELLYLVGGKSYAIGYITIFNEDKRIVYNLDFPFELRSITKLGDNLFAAGFGALMQSQNGGIGWKKLAPSGDFFVSLVKVNEDICFLIGQEGLIYKSENGGTNWSSFRAKSNKQINGARIFDNTLFLFCNDGIYQTYDVLDQKWKVFDVGKTNLNDGLLIDNTLILVGDNGFIGELEI